MVEILGFFHLKYLRSTCYVTLEIRVILSLNLPMLAIAPSSRGWSLAEKAASPQPHFINISLHESLCDSDEPRLLVAKRLGYIEVSFGQLSPAFLPANLCATSAFVSKSRPDSNPPYTHLPTFEWSKDAPTDEYVLRLRQWYGISIIGIK